MTKNKYIFILIFLLLIVGMIDQARLRELQPMREGRYTNTRVTQPLNPTQKVANAQIYIEHAPITITSDSELNNSVVTGFTGNGTIDDPILIEGYNITSSSGDLISISDTTFYFNITNCLLNGLTFASNGIRLANVASGTIEKNIITNAANNGIYLIASGDNTIKNNTIENNGIGINLENSDNNWIINNSVTNSYDWTEINMWSSSFNILTNNTIHSGNHGVGIIGSSNMNTFSNNTIYDIVYVGMFIDLSSENLVSNNKFFNTGGGIKLENSSYTTIESNTISNSTWQGIWCRFTNFTTITQNTVRYSNTSGIFILNNTDVKITKNICYNNGYKCRPGQPNYDDEYITGGITILGQRLEVTNNSVFNNWHNGILVGWGPDNNISHNVVRNNSRNGIVVGYEANNTLIKSNEVSENIKKGILLGQLTTRSVVTSNLCYDNEDSGIVLLTTNNNTIVTNIVQNNIGYGIFLETSNNNTIDTNTVQNNDGNGIFLQFSSSNQIRYNIIQNNGGVGTTGIRTESSKNNTLAHNTLSNNGAAIEIRDAMNVKIINNTIHTHSEVSIGIEGNNSIVSNNTIYDGGIGINGNDNWITGNMIFNNEGNGIDLANCNNNTISKNTIDYTFIGIYLYGASNNTISRNTVSNSVMQGIIVEVNADNPLNILAADNNTIDSNVIYDNGMGGIEIYGGNTNTITRNDFFGNSAYDGGEDNVFTSNYWYDWSGVGAYTLGGNQDPSPLINPYHLSSFIITAPTTDNLTLSGLVPIQWTASTDTFGHDITYSIYYSPDDGGNWITITSGLITASYTLDTTTIADGTTILFKVHVVDSVGFFAKAIHTQSFFIANTPHQLSNLSITSPIKGDTLIGEVTIIWTPALDTWNHKVYYNLYYSIDNGTTWVQVATGLTTTSYSWDTSIVADGTNYIIKVNASCIEGLFVEDMSDGPFMVHNEISSPTISSPDEGETISGTFTIEWSAVIDPCGHSITYTIYYSSDEGATWIKLASDLTTTSFSWDTTTVPNGFSYLIKVVATCSEGLSAEDVTDDTFTVQNEKDTTTKRSVSTPEMTGFMLLCALGTIIAVRKRRKK